MEKILLLLGVVLLAVSGTRADGETDATAGEQTEPAGEPAAILAKILERLRYLQQAKAELSAQIQSGEESPEDRELLKATLQAVIAERNQLLADSRKLRAEQEGKEGKPTPKDIGTPGKKKPSKAPAAETRKGEEPTAQKAPEETMEAETSNKGAARFKDRIGVEQSGRRFYLKRPREPLVPRAHKGQGILRDGALKGHRTPPAPKRGGY